MVAPTLPATRVDLAGSVFPITRSAVNVSVPCASALRFTVELQTPEPFAGAQAVTDPEGEAVTTSRTQPLAGAVPETVTELSSMSLMVPLASTGVVIVTEDMELTGCDGLMETENVNSELKVAFLS